MGIVGIRKILLRLKGVIWGNGCIYETERRIKAGSSWYSSRHRGMGYSIRIQNSHSQKRATNQEILRRGHWTIHAEHWGNERKKKRLHFFFLIKRSLVTF